MSVPVVPSVNFNGRPTGECIPTYVQYIEIRNGEILTDTGRLLSRLQLLSMRRIDYDIYQPLYTACEENKTTVITFLHFNRAFSFNTNTPDQMLNRLRLQLKKNRL